ncbi:hypothetical protein RI030_01485 [Aphanizomenon flos-aquae NRERC-008]|jgi:hypothetical protein|uniref:Uncharacterized protein n=1 Tax=Aphanizomenon flos-aquae FACHB-1249 TaxID=2692889 RepID=A0ABR8IKU4_APHFL|nr:MULTISPECIES: hypothetical protein [Aphanizomenon]MCE2903462.1 hypothetical protein [Anabaena sp. CoA2_C59]MDJ0505504.1 hypothetical protein [Nostocales cyanobacterium LE14-WE12]MBD2390541.1 hypothetical protein [Aphanizomenon flos-aquae FACHB-1171]MBD2558498.1 hypothetical protein [Aphanizomenon flos-aquae FACHB-1290]MBD2632605.1 hypothetical protein [Aphanizomenon sp. FACHB-1399]
MATIVISDLQEKTFLYDLNSEQTQKLLGTGIIPLPLPFLGGRDVALTTVYDGINNLETAYRGPFSFYDNKIFTLDLARSAVYLVL